MRRSAAGLNRELARLVAGPMTARLYDEAEA